ncbi:MAG: EpsG family protein [Sellimonas sp.]|uniref:EpsG family protein n=1 Tax=Sellimonas sp. TaxID=2021466 RepID=UPI0039A3441E
MILTNYWWLLVWIFLAGAFFSLFPREKIVIFEKEEYRWRLIPASFLVLPYILWAGFRTNFGDSLAYKKMFNDVPSSLMQIGEYFTHNSKDQGFSVLMVFLKSIFGNSTLVFFMIIAIFQMLCLVLTYRKYSCDYWMSIFLFIASTDYLSWMHNGIRQFIAAAAIFACFGMMVRKKYTLLICIILLMATIHGSALMMIPIAFIIQGKAWNKKTLIFILGVIVAILFIDRLTPILNDVLVDTQYNDLVTNDLWATDDGTNILRVLVYSMPAILSLIGRKYVREANDPVINLSVNCSIITAAIYALSAVSSGIYIGRLPIYTSLMNYIAMPWLIENIFTKESARIVKLFLIFGYLAFFYFQMHFTWALL